MADYEVHHVSIREIMERTVSSIDVGSVSEMRAPEHFWFELFEQKVLDYTFWWLVDKFLDSGASSVPIQIIVNDDDDSWQIGNGHHRLAAALLCVLDSIPVVFVSDYRDHDAWRASDPDGMSPYGTPCDDYEPQDRATWANELLSHLW